MSKTLIAAVAALTLTSPGAALASPHSIVDVFVDAAPEVKVVMLALIVALVAAIAVAILKVRSGPHLTGGSAFLSGLRLGGPLFGCLGAAYGGVYMCIGLANAAGPVPIKVMAPGFAEIVALLMMGFLTGAVAVVANWVVESRIDRAVLRA